MYISLCIQVRENLCIYIYMAVYDTYIKLYIYIYICNCVTVYMLRCDAADAHAVAVVDTNVEVNVFSTKL